MELLQSCSKLSRCNVYTLPYYFINKRDETQHLWISWFLILSRDDATQAGDANFMAITWSKTSGLLYFFQISVLFYGQVISQHWIGFSWFLMTDNACVYTRMTVRNGVLYAKPSGRHDIEMLSPLLGLCDRNPPHEVNCCYTEQAV